MNKMNDSEMKFIADAKDFFENDSVLIKMTNAIGKPIEIAHEVLPKTVAKYLDKGIDKAIKASLATALKTLGESSQISFEESLKQTTNNRWLHGTLSGVSGGICGFFGGPGILVDLPLTTTLMMRNISSIANSYGFGISDPTMPLECLYVFTLGSKSEHDDEMDSAYYTSRLALEKVIKASAEFIAVNSAKVVLENIEKGTAPALINFIARIASYFEIVVTEKLVAEAIPVVGAIGGASINVAFCDYFGQAAKYHFGILKLESIYGKEFISEIYNEFQQTKKTA